MLHHQRCADAPLAAHANPKQHSQYEEDGIVRRETAQELNGRKEQHIRHQRTAAAIAVGHHAEQQRANRTHRERSRDRQDDVALGNVEVRGQRVKQEDDDEEVECIEGPAEEPRRHGVPAIGGGLGVRVSHRLMRKNII